MRTNLPDRDYFVKKPIPTRPDVTILEWVASGNDAHLFRAHSKNLQRDLACKVIPRSNLLYDTDGRELWRAEVQKANVLRNSTAVKFEDIQEWQDTAAGIDCVVLIAEFVDGQSLHKFMKDHRELINVPFIVHWLKTMLNLFYEMEMRDVKHGDIHTKNILVEDRSSYDLLGERYIFRVTDFCVADATSERRFKDDYFQLADVLAELLRLVTYSACSPREKFIFNKLRHHFLARHLVEMDVTLDPLARQPEELLAQLRNLDAEYERSTAQESTFLISPFDFLSCEQIGDAPALLHALYSDRFLGLSDIESQNNVVVTGPRGCGKTTVFRSLSLDQKLQVEAADPDQIRYVGVYYRCDDLYFAFPRYAIPARDEALDIPIHFITATLVAKLLDSLEAWGRRYFADEFIREESRAAENLWNVLGIDSPRSPGYASFKAIVSRLNKERLNAAERNRFVNDSKRPIGRCFGPDVLVKICEMLSGHLSFLRGRPVYFYIDDYSAPKVTKDLQANLNRIFMQRASVCFFKLSTESPVSFAKHDIDEKIYVESREFILQNLGLVYLHAEVTPKLTFIEDVFRRRLALSKNNFSARELEDLIGSTSKQNNNDMARQIRKGKKPVLFGKEILCNLSSGDIHYLISLVGNMVAISGTPQELAKAQGAFKIPQAKQNMAIREEAGRFLKNLRGIPRYGEQLVSIVEAFGNVSNSHLKYLDSKNEKGVPPKQASRIEPYEALSLSPNAQQLYDELLRYSVFIEDFRGKSRRGNVVPRLYLRRFLIPHFNLTFSTRDSLELEPADFETFLLNPKAFEQKLRLKSENDAKRFERQQTQAQNQYRLKLNTKDQ